MRDPIDAYAAARAALSGRAHAAPKDDTVAGVRALHNAARSAVKARTAALNQVSQLLITPPEATRARYGHLKGTARTAALARLRPAGDAAHIAVLTALRSMARRVKYLAAEHEALAEDMASAEREPAPSEITDSIGEGVSHELCQALSKVVSAESVGSPDVSFNWSRVAAPPPGAPPRVEFNQAAIDVVDRVSAQLKTGSTHAGM